MQKKPRTRTRTQNEHEHEITNSRNLGGRKGEDSTVEAKTAGHEHEHQLRTRPRNREAIWKTEPTRRSIRGA